LRKTVLIAGAASRLGERILTRALGAPNYREVFVLGTDDMPSTEPKLNVITEAAWSSPIDHVIVVVGTGQAPAVSTNGRRTDVFSPITADQVLPLARHARALGATRFMLVTPIDVLLQPAVLRSRVGNMMEADLHAMGFESLLLVRPSDTELRQRRGGPIQRLLRLVVDSATGMMTSQRYASVSVENMARAIVHAIQEDRAGLSVIETEQLQALAA
jgi:hypothetical protein